MTKPSLVLEEQKTESKRLQLVFRKSKGIEAYLPNDLSTYSGRNFFQLFCADISELKGWFDDFTIDLIELWIDSIIQTGHVTKLIVGEKNESGLRIVLKQKMGQHHTVSLDQSNDQQGDTNGHMFRTN
jgi:hypothetical protein